MIWTLNVDLFKRNGQTNVKIWLFEKNTILLGNLNDKIHFNALRRAVLKGGWRGSFSQNVFIKEPTYSSSVAGRSSCGPLVDYRN
jgi:hypothetical protein